MSELKDGNKFSASLCYQMENRKKKKNNCRSNLALRKEEKFLQLGSNNCNQHALSKLSTLSVKMATLPCCGRHIGCHFMKSPILRQPN